MQSFNLQRSPITNAHNRHRNQHILYLLKSQVRELKSSSSFVELLLKIRVNHDILMFTVNQS